MCIYIIYVCRVLSSTIAAASLFCRKQLFELFFLYPVPSRVRSAKHSFWRTFWRDHWLVSHTPQSHASKSVCIFTHKLKNFYQCEDSESTGFLPNEEYGKELSELGHMTHIKDCLLPAGHLPVHGMYGVYDQRLLTERDRSKLFNFHALHGS